MSIENAMYTTDLVEQKREISDPDRTLHNLSSPVARFLKLCWLYSEQEVHVNTAEQAWGVVQRPLGMKAAWTVYLQKEADRRRYNNFNTYVFDNNFA